jgi:hypothetical protein
MQFDSRQLHTGKGRRDAALFLARRVELTVTAAEVFSLIADPRRHIEIDGSGTVRDVAVKGPDRLGFWEPAASSQDYSAKSNGVPTIMEH